MASAAPARLTVAPTPEILDLLNGQWPLEVPRHRLMRLAMLVGLRALVDLEPDGFRRLVVNDAVETAGIRER
jgi:hypothetical protein